MKELKSEGKPGYTYRHLIDKDPVALRELKRQYEAMAYRTWLQKVNSCDVLYKLTIEKVTI